MTRYPLILAAIAGLLTLGACGGGTDTNTTAPSASSRQDKAFEGALKFAKCMREHGVDMPDPVQDANGRITQKMGAGAGARKGTEDPKMKTAQDACEKYMEAGGGPALDPAEKAKQQDALVAYARCMRSKGIDMPDPKISSKGGVQFRVNDGGEGGVSPESPAFKAADKSCHPLLGDIVKGPSNQSGKP